MANQEETIGIGRRKTAVSSVRMRRGSGQIEVNGRKFETYFPLPLQRDLIMAPIQKFSNPEKVDLIIRVKGGGLEAQAVATRLGISQSAVEKHIARAALFLTEWTEGW